MKPTSTSKNPSHPREAKPRVSKIQPARPAGGAPGAASSSQHKSAAPRASASTSMDAIKQDRITSIALYALFGAVIAGMIYFIALVFLI